MSSPPDRSFLATCPKVPPENAHTHDEMFLETTSTNSDNYGENVKRHCAVVIVTTTRVLLKQRWTRGIPTESCIRGRPPWSGRAYGYIFVLYLLYFCTRVCVRTQKTQGRAEPHTRTNTRELTNTDSYARIHTHRRTQLAQASQQ